MSRFYEHSIIPAALRRNYDVYERISQLGMDLGTFETQVHSLKGRNICSAIFHESGLVYLSGIGLGDHQMSDDPERVKHGEPASRRDGAWHFDYEFWQRYEWQTTQVVITDQRGEATTHMIRYCFAPDEVPRLEPGVDRASAGLIFPADGYVQPLPRPWLHHLFVVVRSINGQVLMFYAMMTALLLYVVISLLGRRVFDMEQLLHRGRYAVAADAAIGEDATPPSGLRALVGISPEFTRTDRWLYYGTLGWSLFWIGVFFVLLIFNLIEVQSDRFWFTYWKWTLLLNMGLGFVTVIWFSLGGLHDVRDIMRRLTLLQRDDADDGRVERESHG